MSTLRLHPSAPRIASSLFTIALFSATLLVGPAVRNGVFAADPTDASKAEVNPKQAQIDQYRERIAKGETEQVIQECTQAITANAKDYAAYVGRGMALHAQRKYSDAIKDFSQAAEAQGRDPGTVIIRAQGFLNRSRSQEKKGDYLGAVDSAYFALLEQAENPAAHNARALAYIGWKKYDKAINSTYRALRVDPKSAEAYSIRGYAYALKENYGQAVKDQTEALKLDPDLAVALERRAAANLAWNKPADAEKDIEAAIKLKPDFAEAYCDRAMLNSSRKNYTQALADLEQAVKVDPGSVRAHYQYAQAMQALRRPEAAIESLGKALDLNGNSVDALNLRGTIYLDQRENAKAADDFSRALTIDSQSIDAYRGRSQALKKLGKKNEYQDDLTKIKQLLHPPGSESSKSKDDEAPPTFKVVSAGVDPARRSQALEAARKIDSLVEANYQKHKIEPNPMTNDAQFVRRVYLDITGTIPTYQQTRSFLLSTDPEKRTKLIDQLLGDDGYASHYFNYWADVLRYTDRLSEDVRGEPYRQWLKQSLAENKPWDEFVNELMTAEGLIWQNPATGYQQRDANMPLDSMNNTVRIFLGTRIGCAQCHNHPFDRWTQKEFYQMAAFTYGTSATASGGDKRFWDANPRDRLMDDFASIEQEEEERRTNYYRFGQIIRVNMRIVNDQTSRKIQLPKDYAYDDAKPSEVVAPKTIFGSQVSIRSDETPRQAFARWLTAKENPRFAKTIANRLWKQVFGAGLIEPVDDMTDYTVAENPELMNYLESQMKDLDYNMKEYLRILFNTKTYQRRACFEEIPVGAPYHFPGPMLRRMSAEQVWDSFLTMTLTDPYGYREPSADAYTKVVAADLGKITAESLLAAELERPQVDGRTAKWQNKHKYKGVLLARASELPSPNPANHFVRMFGQSDRQQISTSSTSGSVPQVLFMFNGPITHMMLEPNTTLYNNVMRKQSVTDGVKAVFLTVLSREPDAEDMKLAEEEIKVNGPAGYGNVIWSLVNTREFLFIQ